MSPRRGKLAERNSTEPSKLVSQIKGLKTRVRNLQSELAESVPKTELEALRETLQAKVSDMEIKLCRYVPKEEADILRIRLRDLESKLAESIPKLEAESRIGELQARLSESKNETNALKEKVARLESKLAEYARSHIEGLEEVPTIKPPTEEKLSELTSA